LPADEPDALAARDRGADQMILTLPPPYMLSSRNSPIVVPVRGQRVENEQCGYIRQFAPLIAAESFWLSRPYQHRVLLTRGDR